jgi:hypothetical protein
MRKILIALFLLLAAHLLAADAPNYAGEWTLDKAASKDLPPYYERITGHTLRVTQSEKELVVAVTLTSDAHEPDLLTFNYKLDGVATKAESQVRTPNGPMAVPTITTAKMEENGALTIIIERELPSRGGEPMKGTTVEKWRLEADGKTLVIDRVDEMRRGKFSSTLVFRKS